MISYKRDVLERQSLSEVEMSRGSPICERVRKRLWNTLKTTFLNVKLQRLCKSHHLQYIIGVGEKVDSPMHRNSLFNDSESILSCFFRVCVDVDGMCAH